MLTQTKLVSNVDMFKTSVKSSLQNDYGMESTVVIKLWFLFNLVELLTLVLNMSTFDTSFVCVNI
jgi:hypothetical protein